MIIQTWYRSSICIHCFCYDHYYALLDVQHILGIYFVGKKFDFDDGSKKSPKRNNKTQLLTSFESSNHRHEFLC